MNARTVEVTKEAENEWVEAIVKASLLNKDYFEQCTPGYYNVSDQRNCSTFHTAVTDTILNIA